MARKRTKKQKKAAEKRTNEAPVVGIDQVATVVLPKKTTPKTKNTATVLDQSQVSLLYKDLRKTLIISVIVFLVLLSIFLYMR